MSEIESPEGPEQVYLSVKRLQRYVISMMLLSTSVGLNIGMAIGSPSKLMLIVSGLGVSASGLLIMYTGSHYSEVDAAVARKEETEPAIWDRLFHGG